MNQVVNQPVINWARQSLVQTVEIKIKEHKVLMAIGIAFLFLIFGGIALALYASAIMTLKASGWTPKVTGSLVGGTVFLGVLVVIIGGLLLLGKLTRRHFAKFLDAEGVRTRGGKTFRWADLYYLDYKKVNTQVDRHQLAVSATRAAIMAGVEKVTVEMVFAGGKAVVPPLILDQPAILGLLNSMPVQRRDDGAVRQ